MLTIRAARAICPADPLNSDEAALLPSGVSVYHILQILAGISTAITAVLTCGLIIMHFARYRVPNEQRQIVRLVAVPLVYAIISLLQIYFYDASEYLRPIADLYEAFALASLLMLFVHFAEPGSKYSDQASKRQATFYSPRQFKHVWVLVFQYHFVRLILFIATEGSLATGRYCTLSNNVQFAHVWMTIFQTISVVFAVGALLKFYFKSRSEMVGHSPGLKLLSFKLIIFLSFIQNLVFSILIGKCSLKSTTYVSYYDITRGVPAAIICVECVFFALSNLVSFSSSEYSSRRIPRYEGAGIFLHGNTQASGYAGENGASTPTQKYPFFAAFISALNPLDILEGFATTIKILTGSY